MCAAHNSWTNQSNLMNYHILASMYVKWLTRDSSRFRLVIFSCVWIFFLLELGGLWRSPAIPLLDITKAGCPRKSMFTPFWHDPCVSLRRNLKKWISAARQREIRSPEPRLVEPQGDKQLKKLLAKEEQRLEQEQKRAAVERRRKQQQEQFQLQHELNHPLRQHHAQNAKILRGGSRFPNLFSLVELNAFHCVGSFNKRLYCTSSLPNHGYKKVMRVSLGDKDPL